MKSRIVKLFMAATIMMIGSNVSAQIQKGNILVGSDIGNLKLGLKSGTDNSFSLNPKAGIFVKDGLAVGLDFSFGTTHVGGQNGSTISYGVGTFGRYYITDETVQVLKQGKFFFEANLGFQGQDSKGGASTNGLGFGFGPGYAYFITPNIGLETSIKYQGIVGFGSEAYQNNLLWNLGFQIYFPYKSAANKVKSGL
jgi:hypothetical protein